MLNIKKFTRMALLYGIVISIVLVIVLPFLWIIISSFSSKDELYSVPPHWIPQKPTLANYKVLLREVGGADFRRSVLNSLIVAISTMLICLIISTPASYAFARLKFPLRSTLFALFLILQMLPPIALMIPLYIMFVKAHLIDSPIGLIILNLGFTIPFATWLLWRFFQSIPDVLEDAARIDGCSRLGALVRVVLPLSAPGIATAMIFVFLNVWNNFLFALIFTRTYRARTLPVAITEFQRQTGVDYGLSTAGAVIGALLPLMITFLFQKYIVRGLISGAVKG